MPDPAASDEPGDPAGPEHPLTPRRALHRTRADRLGDAAFRAMARLGVGPAHLLTTRGRRTGRSRSNPVILVHHDGRSWLVSPYGAVPWALNARAAGRVHLRRGRDAGEYTVREVPPADAGPVLQAYVAVAPATRSYFYATTDARVDRFVAEAALHPVFELTPVG